MLFDTQRPGVIDRYFWNAPEGDDKIDRIGGGAEHRPTHSPTGADYDQGEPVNREDASGPTQPERRNADAVFLVVEQVSRDEEAGQAEENHGAEPAVHQAV